MPRALFYSDSVTVSVRVAARSVSATCSARPSCSAMRAGCASVRTTRRGLSATRASLASLDCQTRCVKVSAILCWSFTAL